MGSERAQMACFSNRHCRQTFCRDIFSSTRQNCCSKSFTVKHLHVALGNCRCASVWSASSPQKTSVLPLLYSPGLRRQCVHLNPDFFIPMKWSRTLLNTGCFSRNPGCNNMRNLEERAGSSLTRGPPTIPSFLKESGVTR